MANGEASITQEPRFAEKIKRWEAFWALEDLGRPLWLVPTSPAQTSALLGMCKLPDMVMDKEIQLKAELDLLRWRESFGLEDDFVPHLQPQGGTSVFASAFGCEVQYFDHTLPWAHPVIREHDPAEKVYDLQAPKVTNGQLGQMLEFNDYFVAQTGGRYPIALTDLQGPLDTAYLVWDSSAFMLAMYTNPKEVHHLMRLVTDLIIDYVKEQRARSPEFIPCHFPPVYLPDGMGVSLSDDGLAVISAKLYEEFCLPYVNELSEEFGGVLIHSCGNFVHQLDNLEKVRGLRGINFGASETPFEAIWERFNGKTAIIPHLGLNNPHLFDGNKEFMEHVARVRTHDRGLCVLAAPGQLDISFTDPDSIPRFLRRAKETLMRLY
jgi:Uroporphyrinogen decarboxylase (URO-D)